MKRLLFTLFMLLVKFLHLLYLTARYYFLAGWYFLRLGVCEFLYQLGIIDSYSQPIRWPTHDQAKDF